MFLFPLSLASASWRAPGEGAGAVWEHRGPSAWMAGGVWGCGSSCCPPPQSKPEGLGGNWQRQQPARGQNSARDLPGCSPELTPLVS